MNAPLYGNGQRWCDDCQRATTHVRVKNGLPTCSLCGGSPEQPAAPRTLRKGFIFRYVQRKGGGR